jgi:hypothetical protein
LSDVNEITQPKKIRQAAFLSTFRACANITKAAAAIGIERKTHYDWLENDEAYREEFKATMLTAAHVLEEKALKLALEDENPTMIIFLLKGALPDKYRERATFEHTGKDGKPLLDFASVRAYVRDPSSTS